jgi:CDGSH iron-sulfur domain-containing protein 3
VSGPTHDPERPPSPPSAEQGEQPTAVVPRDDASLELRGDLRVYHSDGRPLADAGALLLCRCGNSEHKPFCDGSHQRVEFRSRPPEAPRDRLEAETPAAFTPNPRVPDPRGAAAASDPDAADGSGPRRPATSAG